MRIGIDVDGVLAEFTTPFLRILNHVNGTHKTLEGEPLVWDWPQQQLGFTDEQVAKAWDWIEENPGAFWPWEAPLIDQVERAMLAQLCEEHDVYFISWRSVGPQVKQLTEAWLRNHLRIRNPTVILSHDKGQVAAALKLDVFVDDCLENISAVYCESHSTRCYVIRRAYNQPCHFHSVNSIGQVLTEEGLDGQGYIRGTA